MYTLFSEVQGCIFLIIIPGGGEDFWRSGGEMKIWHEKAIFLLGGANFASGKYIQPCSHYVCTNQFTIQISMNKLCSLYSVHYELMHKVDHVKGRREEWEKFFSELWNCNGGGRGERRGSTNLCQETSEPDIF